MLIKEFSDGSLIEIGQGRFDDWCVYLTIPTNNKHAPRDYKYFKVLKALGARYGADKVYNDFLEIYNLTSSDISEEVLDKISKMSEYYEPYCVKFDIVMTVIYLGMIAEENKAGTKLGKRIKRLGIHQVLKENLDPEIAANYSRGKGWKFIDYECKIRDF